MKKSGPDRQYPEEFRRAAVSQVIEGGQDCLATTKHIYKLERENCPLVAQRQWSDDSRAMKNDLSVM